MFLTACEPVPADSPAVAAAGAPAVVWERPAGELGRGAAAPDAALAGDGAFLLVWERHGDGESDVVVCRREDGAGGDWGEPRRLDTDPPGSARSLEPHVVVGPGGLVLAVWQDGRDGRPHVRVNRSTDDGRTWLPEDVAVAPGSPGPGTMPAAAFDAAGCAWVAWEDGRDGARDIRLARSTDGGATWEPDRRVDSDPPGASSSWHPRVVALAGPRLLVVWWDERDGLADLYVRRAPGRDDFWSGPEVRLDPGPAGTVRSHGAVIGLDGPTLRIRWQEGDGPGARWVSRTSTDGGSSWDAVRREPPTSLDPAAAAPVISTGGDTLLVRCLDGPQGPELRAAWRRGAADDRSGGVSGRKSDRPGE